MSALNSLPLPVVRLLAFFHEELSERRPGRVPQTVQLWVGCLLVILISMTFEIPFVALSLAVLFYGIQSNAFYTKFVAILFVVATMLEIGSLFLIYKWSYGEPLIRLIIAGPILMGCMFLMRTHRLGLVFFAVAIYGQTFPAMLDYPEVVVRLTLWCIVVGLYPHCRYLRANLPRHARLSGSGRALNGVVYRCWPLSNLADDVNRRAVVSQSCHFANASGA